MSKSEGGARFRLALCAFATLGAYGFLAIRSAQLQIIPDPRIADLKEKQKDRSVLLASPRGTIHDARGRALAVSLQVSSVFADPSAVEDHAAFAKAVAPVLGIPRGEILAKIKKDSRRFVWLKRKVGASVAAAVRKLSLAGLQVTKEAMRFYPEREFGAQLFGFVGVDGEGLEGLERSYDKLLKGPDLTLTTERDRKGRAIFSNPEAQSQPEPGANLHLTIDASIQHFVEEELILAAKESGSKKAMAVVMDPNEGRILAMASYPQVNPNRQQRSASNVWRNRPVEEVFEPGSTFKVFSIAAALEHGAIAPQQSVLCRKGSLQFGHKVIRTHHESEWLTPAGVIKHSDNIGTARIALETGRRPLYETISRLGFASPTEIDYPGEAKGLLKGPERWRDVDLANISFGQGIGVTAIQMLTALSAIANGGLLVRPYLATRAVSPDGRELVLHGESPPKRVLSEQTAHLLSQWMEAVTSPDGTAPGAAIEGYRVAGKTGTAQRLDPVTGTYDDKSVVSSFFGFVPAEAPRLASIFVFDDPEKGDFGGALAGPVFHRAMKSVLGYLGIPPTEPQPRIAAPVLALPELGRKPKAPEPKILDLGPGRTPDFQGLTIREVLHEIQKRSLSVRVFGTGVAVRQTPEPGRALRGKEEFKVYFAPPEMPRGDA